MRRPPPVAKPVGLSWQQTAKSCLLESAEIDPQHRPGTSTGVGVVQLALGFVYEARGDSASP